MDDPTDRVAALVDRLYGLAVERLEPAPRGWTGLTYAARLRDGSRVFVKVYPRERLPRTAAPALPVLGELHRLGLTEVTRPIPSARGALHEWLGDDLVVVFDYIDAAQAPASSVDGERIGDLLARVHQQTGRITTPVVRETFEPRFGDELWQTIARARQSPPRDDLVRGLDRFLGEHEQAIADGWAAFEGIARRCRAARFELRLTHGDWPFNLLRDAGGTVYLVDWDELIFAPAERDTWFADDAPDFWRGYRARRNDHARSGLATAYYVHFRYFEELVSFCQVVLGDGSPAARAESLDLLGNEWMSGLLARIGSTPSPEGQPQGQPQG